LPKLSNDPGALWEREMNCSATSKDSINAFALRWRNETINAREEWNNVSGQSNIETLMGYVRKERGIWESPRTVALMRLPVSRSADR